ncbi:putative transcriptional regulator, winged helix family [Lysobacter dokdonensis DS-58]|uniref:Putative transcriptional regulator, winged helix family n=1 Tax=Lysobacter dokdonensis DS-58 TaxID=1300345 RepID=A0A0A2WLU8_9GAMM|nr:BTAD domain-containing putative transcriptional regulator [Lysobacter dokdonensis]KGQ19672.1 putative transcriptional regulator, winged helix family [Lysobacter dokdonensis DS-58]
MPLAKLTRPKLHQVLPRERLFARLDDAARPIVWVVGPPGAGKTALVASWLQQHKVGGVWYQVDAGDRDLSTFFHYLGRAAPPARKRDAPLPTFTPEHGADPAAFARLYFRALFERFKPPAALVFDNYHELPAGAPLHALLDAIAREIPERVVIVATSRGEPPPECAALRAMDRVALLDWDELRLTFDETCGIAALRQHLDDTTLRAVHAQSDGWPVGLVLTLEQVKRGHVDASAAQSQGREVLFGYFAGQILDALSPAVQVQLMRIALLPRATAAQAAMIAGDPGAGHLLDSLYRRRLFVERRGEAYQFHDLFRAFLLERLQHAMPPEALAEVRRAAIVLLSQAEQVEAAFDIAAAAQDWATAAQLTLRFAPMLLEQGRVATLKAWFDVLPPQAQDASPWMALWHGVAMSPFAALQARARFEAAFARFGDEEPMGRILSIGAILATHYLEFDHGQVDQWIDELLPRLENPPPYPAAAAELRVNAALLFALSFQRPRADLTEAVVARLRALLQRDDIPVNPRVDAATLMLAHHQINGEFDETERIAAMAAPWVADPTLTPSYRALWLLQLAHFRDKQGDDVEALKLYDEAQAIANENALMLPPLRIFIHLGRAIVALCAGDADTAEAERVKGAAYWNYSRKLDRALDGAIRTWVAVLRGEHATAVTIAREMVAGMDAYGPVWLRFGGRLLLAIAEFEADPDVDLAPILDESRALLEGTCLQHHVHGIEAVEAWVALRRHGLAAARPLIERSVSGLNAHHGQFMLRMHPTLLSEVYGAALQLGIAEGDARRAIREYVLRAPDADPPRWPWQFEVRTLGRFEVLREGQPLAFSRKIPKKTLALLKAIIALGGRSVSEQRLLDALWPDEEGDAGARALDATVLRLRALLGDPAAIVQKGGRVSLDPQRMWVDVFAFDRSLAAADEAAHRHDGVAEALPLNRALELYGGAFLLEDEGEAWPVATRERLRGRFIHALARQAERLETAGDDTAAIALYMRGIDADPAIESFYQGLMRCYDRSGRRSEAIAAYQRLRQILSITLGLQPSQSSERLYQQLMR